MQSLEQKAKELADKIEAWRLDDDHEDPMGHAFDLLNNEIEPFLRRLVEAGDIIERRFDGRFVMDFDNVAYGPKFLFRINPDGSRSIATADDVKAFIAENFRRRKEAIVGGVPQPSSNVPLPPFDQVKYGE